MRTVVLVYNTFEGHTECQLEKAWGALTQKESGMEQAEILSILKEYNSTPFDRLEFMREAGNISCAA